jgi:hypothetical protein
LIILKKRQKNWFSRHELKEGGFFRTNPLINSASVLRKLLHKWRSCTNQFQQNDAKSIDVALVCELVGNEIPAVYVQIVSQIPDKNEQYNSTAL